MKLLNTFVVFGDADGEVIEEWPDAGIDIFRSVAWFDPVGRFPSPFDEQRLISEAWIVVNSGRGHRKPPLSVSRNGWQERKP